MRLIFQLRFHTKPGQSLSLTGSHVLFGGGDVRKAVPLQYLNPEFWQAVIELPAGATPDENLRYHYLLRNADGSVVEDWGDKAINPARFRQTEVLIVDAWNPAGLFENAFYTEPFQQVLLRANQTEAQVPAPPNPTHTFSVKAPLLAKNQTLCLLGEFTAQGHWNTASPLLLNRMADEEFFSAQVDLSGQSFPLAYKYGVFDVEQKRFLRYEDGANRVLHAAAAPGRHVMVHDGFARLPADTWKGAGVAIPVFSLRSENSFGVGEFADLKPLADWCSQVGLKLIQILPVNDTTATHTWTDSYPYAAISAFALHPMYLNLTALVQGGGGATATSSAKNQKLLAALEPERQRLNALETVDYEAVMKTKLGFLKKIFPSQKTATFRSREYKKFLPENEHWLLPYAAFCVLRDRFGTADFNRWPEHQTFDAGKIVAFAMDNDEVAFHCFVQFHLHRQLQEAVAHAHERGVILKGDIAIGVYRHGADVWQQPELFHTEVQAGAPPDAFAAKGQNWGFPTYNWPRMKRDGFAWWKRRFAQMGCYFDAFRIDHILGFFRIWSIPAHAVEGILGHFVPAIPVEVDEFAARGIVFDRERLTQPFITDAVLKEIFGEAAETVRREFLNARPDDRYELKPEFATQRQVENYFTGWSAESRSAEWHSAVSPTGSRRAPADSQSAIQQTDSLRYTEHDAKIKLGLFDLISNVILFEAEGSPGKQFHFRLGMDQTSSFKYLPPDTQAKLKALYVDYFFRRQDDFWAKEAAQKLSALKRVTNMLICGEDLGMVPDCVPVLMKEFGLLSLEIQRMPKKLGQEFSRPADAPYLSVVTPSTHDMSTLRGWWEEDRALTQKFFNAELGQSGDAPREASPEIVEAIVRQHLASPAMWSIFQLQDWLGTDAQLRRRDIAAERINVPAIPQYYWRYRMHLTLEKLQAAEGLKATVRELLRQSGR